MRFLIQHGTTQLSKEKEEELMENAQSKGKPIIVTRFNWIEKGGTQRASPQKSNYMRSLICKELGGSTGHKKIYKYIFLIHQGILLNVI